MKCIKAIKATKYAQVGDIVRLKEFEANEKVDTGYWEFVNKTEWKKLTRVKIVENQEVTNKKEEKEKKSNKKTLKK
jgi:hypothetical protein